MNACKYTYASVHTLFYCLIQAVVQGMDRGFCSTTGWKPIKGSIPDGTLIPAHISILLVSSYTQD